MEMHTRGLMAGYPLEFKASLALLISSWSRGRWEKSAHRSISGSCAVLRSPREWGGRSGASPGKAVIYFCKFQIAYRI